MPTSRPSNLNIGLVGSGDLCHEVLEKTCLEPQKNHLNARIVALADTQTESPSMVLAKNLGLHTPADYHELYGPKFDLHLIITLTEDTKVFEDILKTKPAHTRLMAYPVFKMFWEALSLERERVRDMKTILNGIQDFILVITPDREIVDVNEAFLKQMGYSREQVLGQKCHEVFQGGVQPCNHGDVICPLNETIRNKRPSLQVLTRRDHNGERRYVEVAMFPVWETDGRISRFIEISRDITDRKREEEEITRRLEQMVEMRTRQLEETHAKLIHQDKMASLGKLSASVVHEINNPIAGILNLVKLIKRILEEGSPQKKDFQAFNKYLNLMETETKRISRIVSNLLAFSRQSKLELKKININRLIENTLFLNSNLLKINGIKVEKNFDTHLPQLVGSEDQLHQVFMNFVSNAAEAMESSMGGVLTIETRHASGNGTVLVRLRDTGIGIPQQNLSKLFEPFFTTKKKGKGVGLGLSVAYGIIQEHGGSIRVESEEGQGTLFEVELPLKQPPPDSGRQGGSNDKH